MQHHVVTVVVALPPLRFWGWEAMKFIIWFYRFTEVLRDKPPAVFKRSLSNH
jgi:hypothetical protein